MPIEDVFNIEAPGTVATGRVERGIQENGGKSSSLAFRPTAKTVATDIRDVPQAASM